MYSVNFIFFKRKTCNVPHQMLHNVVTNNITILNEKYIHWEQKLTIIYLKYKFCSFFQQKYEVFMGL